MSTQTHPIQPALENPEPPWRCPLLPSVRFRGLPPDSRCAGIDPHVDPAKDESLGSGFRPARRIQFAEMIYLMVMSSDEMRAKVKALARRCGVSDIETRADVMGYFSLLAAAPDQVRRRADAIAAREQRAVREL